MMRSWIRGNFRQRAPNGRNPFVGRIEDRGDGAWLWRVYERGPLIAMSGVEPTDAAARAAVEANQAAFRGYAPRDPIVAVHEAAHAVVAHLTQFCDFVTDLVADDQSPSVGTQADLHAASVWCVANGKTADDIRLIYSGVFAAGYVAEVRYLKQSELPFDEFICLCGAHGDRKLLKEAKFATWEAAKAEAERVMNPPNVWQAVLNVAEVLERHDISLARLQGGAIGTISGLCPLQADGVEHAGTTGAF